MWVVPMFLPAGSRFSTRRGISAPERDLERAGADVDVVVAAGRRVQVDAVHADADRVGVADRALVAPDGQRQVLLDDGVLGPDAARLADVRRLGQAVRAAGDVAAQPQSRETRCRRRVAAPRSAASTGPTATAPGPRRDASPRPARR